MFTYKQLAPTLVRLRSQLFGHLTTAAGAAGGGWPAAAAAAAVTGRPAAACTGSWFSSALVAE